MSLTKDAIERVAARYKAGTLHAELCRLALLGLRVEEAPVYVADQRRSMWPVELGVEDGKRVRVVEEP